MDANPQTAKAQATKKELSAHRSPGENGACLDGVGFESRLCMVAPEVEGGHQKISVSATLCGQTEGGVQIGVYSLYIHK